MTDSILTDPSQACETTLRAERQYTKDHEVLANDNAVVDRLLARRPEMNRAYAEIY